MNESMCRGRTLRQSLTLVWLAGMVGCAPTLAGRLSGPAGEVVTSPEARVNIISLASSGETAGSGATESPATIIAEVDGSGEFATSEALPAGDYLVEALVPGYALQSQKVRIGETDRVEMTMTPLTKLRPKATSANMDLDAGRGGGGATLTPPSL